MIPGKTVLPHGPIKIITIALMACYIAISGCSHSTMQSKSKLNQPFKDPIFYPDETLETAEEFTIGPGDILEISVWKNEDLSRQVIVLPDGMISFPLVGRILAGGKTADQMKSDMEKEVKRYVPDPELAVIVQQVNSMVIYVIGKVNSPGRISLNRNISVLQALSMVGGLNIFADTSDINIVRKQTNGTLVIPFNYKEVTENHRMEADIQLQRGDVIIVK